MQDKNVNNFDDEQEKTNHMASAEEETLEAKYYCNICRREVFTNEDRTPIRVRWKFKLVSLFRI